MFGKDKGDAGSVVLFDKTEQPAPVFATFQGARMVISDDDDKLMDFEPRGEVAVNVNQILAIYDNTIVVSGCKLRVMGTVNEILLKIVKAGR